MPKRPGELRIGTSGYQYDHWKGVLYPPEVPKREWLGHYAQRFDTVEINNTFYRLPGPAAFDGWRERAPRGFLYALKFSRFGSHLKKLTDPHNSIGRFVEMAERLGPCLGPILVQLPPRWGINLERLEAFLDVAPRRIRWAFEFRDGSWLGEPTFELLGRYAAGLCIHDMVPQHPWRLTAGWTYLRYHGVRYAGSYTSEALAEEAGRIRRCLSEGLDVYAYFNNDIGGHAVWNALDLRRMVTSRT